MKKILSFLLAACMVLCFAGCAPEDPVPETEVSEQVPSETALASEAAPTAEASALPESRTAEEVPLETGAIAPDTFLSQIRPALEALYACDQELYGALADFEEPYLAGYRHGRPDILYPATDPRPEGYEEDPADARYYLVSNYFTLDDIRIWLSFYMSQDVIEKYTFLEEDFLEFEGRLYLCRGGRGYGALLCDPDSAAYAGIQDGCYQITLDYNLFDQYSHTALITFRKAPEGWKIQSIEELTD